MTDRPIIFSGGMAEALFADAKTQTRRLATSPLAKCKIGDRLWVREAFGEVNLYGRPGFLYRADHHTWDLMDDETYLDEDGSMNYDHPHAKKYEWLTWVDDLASGAEGSWRPSIHMPRWVSRMFLQVIDVRFQSLHQITEDDATAEGIKEHYWTQFQRMMHIPYGYFAIDPNANWAMLADAENLRSSAIKSFEFLWDTLHGDKSGEAWADNPEIVALTFKVIKENIDGGER